MIWLALCLSLFSSPAVDPQLEKAVRTFWDLLQRGDKVGALRYVAPESRNPFLNRRTDPFLSWELDRIELRSPDEALVTVKVEQMLLPSGAYYPVPSREVWIRGPDGWRIRVRRPDMEKLKRAFVGAAAPKKRGPKPGVLEVVPRQVKIHFLDRSRRGAFRIRNGLSETVQISRIDYDKTRFELLDSGDSVAPGQDLRLSFRYIGNESKKGLSNEFRLLLKRGGDEDAKEQLFTVRVLYNYVSPGARGLLGLTGKKLDQLKRGETVKPVVASPPSPPPLPGLPPAVDPEAKP
ncbi:MAG: nuclear transport factor 2 family protein [Candidatus Aminicenantes bacterium]|nr:nuclear transport factor 2 family protein [Candidatus Aminicenantes bacterium]